MDLETAYGIVSTEWTDIFDNIPAIERHVEELNPRRIIELGVRGGVSTVVFLYALDGFAEEVQSLDGTRHMAPPGELWSVDTQWPTGPLLPALNQPNWIFTHGDDCGPEILRQLPGNVDLVFIDTTHSYAHTHRELAKYWSRVRKGGRILLHDTELEFPETAPGDKAFPVRRAATEFAGAHDLKFENDPRP